MGHERWFRGQHDGQGRPFDWRAVARQQGIPETLARTLYERAVREARGASQVEEIYRALLGEARPGTERPSPGKVTRAMRLDTERASRHRHGAPRSQVGRPSAAPGKRTLSSYLAPRDPAFPDRSSGTQDDHRAMDAMTRLLRSYGLPAPAAEERPRDVALHTALSQRLDDTAHTLDDLPWTAEAMSAASWADDAAEEPWADDEAREEWATHAAEAPWVDDEAREEWDSEPATEEPWVDDEAREEWTTHAAEEWDATAAAAGKWGEEEDEQAAEPATESLPVALRARMERAFGQDFGAVVLHPDSPEATGATRALTRGNEIHFRAGAYEPGTTAGDWLIAHELAHVVQQTARPGQSAGRRALEREADLAASAMLAGRGAAVSLGASMGAVLAFSDDEDHDVDAQEAPTPDSPAAAGAAAEAATEAATKATTGAAAGVEAGAPAAMDGASQVAGHVPLPETANLATGAADGEPAAGAADTATETSAGPDAEGTEGAEGNEAALLAEIRSPVPAEGGGGGAGSGGAGGGGGEAVAEEAAVPEVSGSPPEQGLGALQGVRPDKLASALDGVRTAASSEVSQERAALAADPPQQMSTGDAAGAAAPGAGAPGGAEGVAAGQDTTAAGQPGQPGQAGQPGQPGAAAAGEDAQAAQGTQGTGASADTTAASHESPPPVAATRAPVVENAPADENNAKGGISQADAGRMTQAIASVPTRDPHANADPGPAPELAMTEDARASARTDRDSLDTSLTGAETTAATHIAQPMGEDHIDVTLAPEALKAQLTAGDTAAEAGAAVAGAGKALGAAKAEALGDAGESAAIIAKLERGAEIDAALATAQGQVAAERQAHTQGGVDERARADQELAALETQSEAEQEQARTDARAQVDQARTDWQAEVDTQTATARTEADAEVKAGLADVETEQSNANSEAERHIDKGRTEAEAEQKRGEEEAERVKKDKEKESSGGFFGWLASEATAFFEGLKQAISSVLDAARRAIKRVIEVAKKLAVQVIEAARKAIVATIKAVGKALIAIGDRLLAAFPALRERFRATIQGFVDQAVEAVNQLAESLKENVQKALDLLGKGLDAALGLLEKGLHAIVDGVNAVVQGAISFAKGVVEALGAFAVLIKDIAGDPGGWLGKLGGAVMDGIQNHLWGALQTAVLGWFQSKVLELLGIGGIVVQLLMEGGIDMGQISSMAWEALQTAIPAALVAILIEKLVSMIVPAAGAVLAIIEGLQAAWGTVSRIIAAFGAFVAFLKAVKGGAAGPLFANLIAAAAVVVLDFVANWLLRKLASAARKVGAKLKNLAEKFKRRRKSKGKPDPKRSSDPHDAKTKSDSQKKADKDKQNRERLDEAVRALQPKITSLLQRGVSRIRLRAQLLLWKVQHGLTGLWVEGADSQLRIIAQVNPKKVAQEGLCLDRNELLTLARKVVAREVRRRESYVPSKVQGLLEQDTPGRGKRRDHQVGTMPDGSSLNAREYQQKGHTNAVVYGEHEKKRMEIGTYEKIADTIKATGMSDKEFAQHMIELVKMGKVSEVLASSSKNTAFAGALKLLMFGREAARNPMALLTAAAALERVASGDITWAQLFTGKAVHNEGKDSEWGGGGLDPMSMKKAPAAARETYQAFGMNYPVTDQDKLETTTGTKEQAEELQEREKDMLLAWLNQRVGRENLVFKDKPEAEYQMARILIRLCQEWYGKKLAPKKKVPR